MNLWGMHDTSQNDILAIKAISSDNHCFIKKPPYDEHQEEEKRRRKRKQEELDFDLFLQEETLVLEDTQIDSMEIIQKIWQEALGFALSQGLVVSQSSFSRRDSTAIFPWLLTFPGGCFIQERIS